MTETVHLHVTGMMCQKNCGTTVASALEKLIPGATRVRVSFEKSYATVTAPPLLVPDLEKAAVDAVENVGFEAHVIPSKELDEYLFHTVHMTVTGMMCQKSCGTTVENALLRMVAGVTEARASFADSYATVTARLGHRFPSQLEQEALDAVDAAGFDAHLLTGPELERWTHHTVPLHVEGMMCQKNCGTTVENALRTLPGVTNVKASFAQSYATVTARIGINRTREQLDEAALDVVDCVGFEARLIPDDQLHKYQSPSQQQHTVHLRVTGMMCQKNCGTTVENSLKRLPGLIEARASFAQSYATVTALLDAYPSDDREGRVQKLNEAAIDAVDLVGFDAELLKDGPPAPQDDSTVKSSTATASSQGDVESLVLDSDTATLQVNGMSCAICVGRVENMLKEVEGVTEASVVLTTHRAQIQVAGSADLELVANECAQVVTQGGYESKVLQLGSSSNGGVSLADNAAQMEQSRKHELSMWRNLLILSVSLALPMIILKNVNPPWSMTTKESIMLVLATIAQVVVGKRYYKAAWKGWANGRYLGMDFLIVMGTTASYVYSILVFLAHVISPTDFSLDPTFATGAMLFSFVCLGKFLEAYAKGKTASALQTLMELQPQMALRVETQDDLDSSVDLASLQTAEVDASDLRVGDYLYVLPGARIPADGILVATSDHATRAFVDESALSGEPFPVAKEVGGPVFGATINQLTTLLIRVTASGNSTVLAKIVRLMESAQSQKAPIQAHADRVACIFAPIVLTLSAITLLGWLIFFSGEDKVFLAIMSSISVIVVACPCALGLATPTAVMVGTGVGATHGLLIKGGAVLEGAHSVDTVIFDKTGTLTTGKAIVQETVDFVEARDALMQHKPKAIPNNKVALWLAACAEKQSEHPLAKAIVNAASNMWGGDVICANEGVEVSEFQVTPGAGVECLVRKPLWGEWRVRVGNRGWVTESLLEFSIDGEEESPANDVPGDAEIRRMRQQGQVGVYISVVSEREHLQKYDTEGNLCSRRVIGVVGIADPIQPEAKSTVAALLKMNVDVWMCTGDDETTARAVAQAVGMNDENVCAGVKPEGKADLVTRLQKQDRSSLPAWNRRRRDKRGRMHQRGRVAVVGDGINDAVALARADVGIAIGAGTEVAVEAADMVLVKSSLHDVVVALHLSRVVFQRIRWNFGWAMGYNLIALPFAAGVFYPWLQWRLPPEFAGLMMAFSSVSVVTSSLLLRAYNRPNISEDGHLEMRTWCGFSELKRRSRHGGKVYSGVEPDDGIDEGRISVLELV